MRYDELAFVNLQLAGMLKSGIPLEGALRQLSKGMRRGDLQPEFEKLERDLGAGTPLETALNARKLPDLYRRMVVAGARGNDLPGILTLLADHYQRMSSIGSRLKGLLVYPSIVIVASLALSCFLALLFRSFNTDIPRILGDLEPGELTGGGTDVLIWMPVLVLTAAAAFLCAVLVTPPLRRWLRWRLPGFKEAALAQLASAMRLLLKGGTTLTDALGLVGNLESQTPAGRDIAQWQRRLAEGHARFPDIAVGSTVVPPLFSWLVSSADEDMAAGFQRAAEIYEARAAYRVEMLLYAALPVSILCLGVMLISQAYPVIRLFVQFGSVIDRLGQ
jgi:type II secretory pathway component PulF